MLQGLCEITVTADWRVLVPRRWRCAFNTATRPIALVTRRDPGCWRIYPGDDMRALFAGYERLCADNPDEALTLQMIGSAQRAMMDWRGRIGIAADLRDWVQAAAPFPAVLAGMGGYAELWPRAAWSAEQASGLRDPHVLRLLDLSAPYLAALQ